MPSPPRARERLGLEIYQLWELEGISHYILVRNSLPSCGEWKTRRLKIFGLKLSSEFTGQGPGSQGQEPFGENISELSPYLSHAAFPPSFLCPFPFSPAQHPLLLLAW